MSAAKKPSTTTNGPAVRLGLVGDERQMRLRHHDEDRAQREAEYPALRVTRANLEIGRAPTLLDLIADSIGGGQERDPLGFCLGAFESLADEIEGLYRSMAFEDQPIEDEVLSRMIWRLGARARAAGDIAQRMREAQRAAKSEASK